MKINKTGNIKRDPINRLYATEVHAEKTEHEYLQKKEIIKTSIVMKVMIILLSYTYKLR